MFLQITSCILCGEYITKIKYNLKTTVSKTSNVLLIKFVEKLYKNVFLMHCNICSLCYELLNELDDAQVRQKKLYTKLENYVAKMQDSPFELESKIKDEDSTEEISNFSELSNNKIELNENPLRSETDITKIGDIDLKKLPIKVKRVTSGISNSKTHSKDSVYEVASDPKPKDLGSHEVTEDQEAFEKIQSSIQMDLSKHVQEHMNKYKPTKDVLCEICGQNFKTKMGFENHMKKHGDADDDMKILIMNKRDEDFPCHICGKIFSQKGALSRHLFIHTGETRYQCEECGKKFVHHSSFNMHRKIHAGQRNFKCLECNKGFLTRSHLKRHLRAAHTSIKRHCCEVCGKKFAENYNLIAHVKVVHKPQVDIFYEEVKGEDVFYDI